MTASDPPRHESREHGDGAREPRRQHGHELDGDEHEGTIRQLDQQAQRARLLFGAQRADCHERKQQRHRHVKRSEGRDQHAVQWRKAGGEDGGLQRRRTRLAIQRHRLEKAVADQRAFEQQQRPQRAAAEDFAQLLHEQRPDWRFAGRGCIR